MKDSFIVYTSYQKPLADLTMEQRGILFTALLAYASGALLPQMDAAVGIAFSFIRADMDKNFEKYEKVCEKRREAGRQRQQMLPNATKCYQVQASGTDNEDDNDNDLKEIPSKEGTKKSGFTPPTLQEVQEYVSEKGYKIDPERFIDFYQSKGWYVGKNKMKDWKSAVRNWSRSQREEPTTKGRQEKTVNRFNDFKQRDYDYADLEKRLLGRQ